MFCFFLSDKGVTGLQLYLLRLEQVSPAQLALWASWLPRWELPQSMADLRRRQRICGWGLARWKLSEELGLPPEQVPLTRGAHGGPVCPGRHLSLSHSGNLVACATDSRPVGVDVQQIRPLGRRLLGSFSSEEAAWLARHSAPQRDRAAVQLWALREAWAKCAGQGLGAARRVSFQIAGGAVRCALPGFVCSLPPVDGDYVLAVCQMVRDGVSR